MTNTHLLTRSAAIAATAVLTLAGIVGCGTDDNDSTDDGASGAVSDTAATADGGTDSGNDGDGSGTDGSDGACTADDVTVSLENQQGAAGSMLADITVLNDSDTPCTVQGYPGVALVDADEKTIGAPATREDAGSSEAVSLAPAESATSGVRLGQAGSYDEATCEPTPAAGYQVIIPEETTPVVIGQDDLTACASDEVELLSVQPFTPAI